MDNQKEYSVLVLELANKISRTKMGSKGGIRPEHPEYYVLEPIVTDDMAEVALKLKLREPQSAAEIAKACGKTTEDTSELLWELAKAGVCFVNEIDGVDRYWHDVWIPGHMEMICNNLENVKKYPQLAKAFDEYGKRKGPASAGIFPVGTGPMRVIPIEKAIEGETRRASYEEVSKYLNENHIFSVSDCSCRTAREALGEGCGHLKEDMCIQMGHAAEYYIRTGRGREITRDEAFDIIKRAEENGLMHSIPNLDGPGKTHAICNCCGCSCFAMRIAGMYENNDMVRSNYVARVDKEKCVACGECVTVCPTNATRLGQKICGDYEAQTPIHKNLPSNTEWGEDKWNSDYRTNRKNVVDGGTAPCKTNCPAHIAVQGYIKLASQGRYQEALKLIKEENPFPAVCGRICPRKCESDCTRQALDQAVAIDEIKKFIAERELKTEDRYIPQKRHEYGNKIAVIGSGPSGLSCAYYLAIDGYEVTVFEKESVPGGMLMLGIPNYRLEKEVLKAEIEVLEALGVHFEYNTQVGKDITLDDLRQKGYQAFYLAIGAQKGRLLGLAGETAKGVETGVDFLRKVNLNQHDKLEGPTVVIGGGNVAIDVARTAMRLGSDSVQMICLESRDDMPALEEEIQEALAEGIIIENAWGPMAIETQEGQLVAVKFKKCLSVKDAEGRFNPQYDEEETLLIPASNLLISVGQQIDWMQLLEGESVTYKRNGAIVVDEKTLQSGQGDLFAGGDAMTGPAFAIDAIAQGKEAAISIHRFVQPGQDLLFGRDMKDYHIFDKDGIALEGYDHIARVETHHVDGDLWKQTFKDLRTTFTEEEMKKESERCLSCGATVVDAYKCIGCGACTTRCKFDAIHLERVYDAENVPFEKLKPIVVKEMIKRKGKIAIHKVKDIVFQERE